MSRKKEVEQNPSKQHSGNMPLTGHLRELRNRLLICLIFVLVMFGIFLIFAGQLVGLLTDMGKEYGYQYVFISPQELLLEYFSVSLVAALIISVPLIVWHIWAFVRPGLKKNENRAFAFTLIFGMIFFVLGVLFAYKISVPFILHFLINVGDGSEIEAAISVQNYISFLLTIFVIFGIVFELPVISVVLTGLGILKSIWMRKGRRPVIVVIFILAAFITPPDVVSQIMVALPMLALYELGILLSRMVEKWKKKGNL